MKIFTSKLDGLRRVLTDPRSLYVVVNIAVNFIFLVRSFISMQLLDYRELGLVALLQTIMLLLVSLQFGFLQGGYRLLCGADVLKQRRLNNLLFTFIGLLALVSAIAAMTYVGIFTSEDNIILGAFGLVGGVFTLTKNWMTSAMIALERLEALNRINFISSMAGMAMFALAGHNGLMACLLAVVVPPAWFVVMAWRSHSDLRPDSFEYQATLVSQVMRAGFLPFLIGLFLQLNVLIERWYVATDLGLEPLGHLYLVILYLSIFQLVPNSFDAIFLPRTVRAYQMGDQVTVSNAMRRLFLLSTGYMVATISITVLFAGPVVSLVLPKYTGDLPYLYALLPGLAVMTLLQPLGLIYNVLMRYGIYFVASVGGTAITAVLFAAALVFERQLSLTAVVYVRSIALAFTGIVLAAGYFWIGKHQREFLFGIRPVRSSA